MTMFETELRKALEDAAPEPPVGSGPREFDVRGARRPWLLVAAAALVVVVVSVVAVVLHSRTSHRAPTPATSLPTVPPGMVAVSGYGITVLVPDHFQFVPDTCGAPQFARDTIVPISVETHCATVDYARPPRQPASTIVEVVPLYLLPEPPTTRPTTVDGVRARIGFGREEWGFRSGVLVIPRNDVAVVVVTRDRAEARSVLASVHITPADSNGCVDRVKALRADSDSRARDLVPGRPVSATVCEYSRDRRLLGSRRLSAAELSRIDRVFDRAYVIEHRRPLPREAGLMYLRYVFGYADGTKRVVEAREPTFTRDVEVILTDGRNSRGLVRPNLPRAYR